MITLIGRLLKKSLNQKSKLVHCDVQSMQISAWLSNLASFATDLAANLGCNRFRIVPYIVSKLWVPPSEEAVLFKWNLSRRSFLGQVVNLDPPLCTSILNRIRFPNVVCTGFDSHMWFVQESIPNSGCISLYRIRFPTCTSPALVES